MRDLVYRAQSRAFWSAVVLIPGKVAGTGRDDGYDAVVIRGCSGCSIQGILFGTVCWVWYM